MFLRPQCYVHEALTVGDATQEDLPQVLAVLDECGLPTEGLAAHLPTTIIARNGKEIVGCSALELFEEFALLRSVAVKPSFREHGLALRLTRAALDVAKKHEVAAVFLLTETASTFF